VATVLVNRYFNPDHAATGQLLADLAFHLARRRAAAGSPVLVVTSRQRLEHPRARLPARERLHGVEVRRIWSTRFGRGALAGRALDYLSFHVAALLFLLRELRAGDLLVASTDPPLLGSTAALAARLRGARLVLWWHDVFPEAAQALAVPATGGAVGRVLEWLRDASARAARANVALCDLMAQRLAARGVAADRVHVIHNWSDGAEVRPVAPRRNPLRRALGLDGCFVVGYSGNLGRAHDLTALPDAAARLADVRDLVFLVSGGGAGTRELRDAVARRGLRNVRFAPYQPRRRLAWSLSVPDVHLLSLRPELEGLVVPSKLYGILAAGRPAVHLGSPDGEVGRVLLANGAGRVVAARDAAGLAAVLRAMHGDRAQAAAMGRRGRRLFEQRFERAHAMARWDAVLGRVTDGAA